MVGKISPPPLRMRRRFKHVSLQPKQSSILKYRPPAQADAYPGYPCPRILYGESRCGDVDACPKIWRARLFCLRVLDCVEGNSDVGARFGWHCARRGERHGDQAGGLERTRKNQCSPQIIDQEPIDNGLPSRKPVDSTMMRRDSNTVLSLVVIQYFDVGKKGDNTSLRDSKLHDKSCDTMRRI